MIAEDHLYAKISGRSREAFLEPYSESNVPLYLCTFVEFVLDWREMCADKVQASLTILLPEGCFAAQLQSRIYLIAPIIQGLVPE
jgi:hypothetical protein